MYTPTLAPSDPAQVGPFLNTELPALSQQLAAAQQFAYLQTLHVEPNKPRDGMIVKADGTDWDPGSGAGMYCYVVSAWVFLGGGGGGGTGTVTNTGALTDHALIVGNGGVDVSALPVLTDGQLMVGATGADPAPQTISGDATLSASGVLTLTGGITLGKVVAQTFLPIAL